MGSGLEQGVGRIYTKEQLKGLKQRCTESIAEIANKRSHYKNENTEEADSKEFWTKMNKYKAAITIQPQYFFLPK